MDATPHEQYGQKMEGVAWDYRNRWCYSSQNAFDEKGFCYGWNLMEGNSHSKYLKLNSIEIRGIGTNQNRKRGIAFGTKIVSEKVISNEYDARIIKKTKKLRDQDFSYRKIAKVLNVMEFSTKIGRGHWSGKSVWQILNP